MISKAHCFSMTIGLNKTSNSREKGPVRLCVWNLSSLQSCRPEVLQSVAVWFSMFLLHLSDHFKGNFFEDFAIKWLCNQGILRPNNEHSLLMISYSRTLWKIWFRLAKWLSQKSNVFQNYVTGIPLLEAMQRPKERISPERYSLTLCKSHMCTKKR